MLAEIVETERSYVESLRIIIKVFHEWSLFEFFEWSQIYRILQFQNYMEPLKDSDLMEDGLVDEIFFQVRKRPALQPIFRL